jgi:hypothetical protein
MRHELDTEVRIIDPITDSSFTGVVVDILEKGFLNMVKVKLFHGPVTNWIAASDVQRI